MSDRAVAGTIGSELRRSWLTVAAVVFGMFVTSMPTYAFSIFIGPLSDQFGWTTHQITGWSMAWSAGCILASPVAGALADRIGAKPVILVSVTLMALALASIGLFTQRLAHLYIGGFAMGALTAGAGAITYGRIISGHFRLGLGTALGFMSSGIGLAAVFGPRLLQATTDGFGWRWGFGVAALGVALALPVVAGAMREVRRPVQDPLDSTTADFAIDLAGAIRMPVFWGLAAGSMLYGACVGGVTVNLMPYLTSEGLSRTDAASAAGLFGAATVVGRFSTGIIIDRARIHAAILMALVLVAEGLAFATIGLSGTTLLLLALPVFGFAVGAEADCLAYCTVRIFGRRHYGRIFGIIGMTMLYLGSGAGAMLFAILADLSGGYAHAFLIWSGLAATAACLLLMVSRHAFLPLQGGAAH